MTIAPLWARIGLHTTANAALAFLLLPILSIVPASFNAASFIELPPRVYSLRWYELFLQDPQWVSSLATSLQVATACMLLSLALGIPLAIAMDKLTGPGRIAVNMLILAPLVVPVIVIACAMYYAGLHTGLVGTFWGMVLGHTVLSLPFVVINVGISLRAIDPSWSRAAEGLGAGPFYSFRRVILPNIAPGVLGGAVFAFIYSFDEVVVALFLAGIGLKTLPVRMWEVIRLEFTPVVAVAATFMIVLAALLFVLARLVEMRRNPGS
ncbi:MAG TPA: ABC transporter permease [Alphaproteobacteria bacterium]|nr:ABC transporter permease [Alphaproteobacteria bacterium]